MTSAGFQRIVSRNALVISISLAIVLAFLLPGVGQWLGQLKLTVPLVMVIFVCQGLGVKSDDLQDIGHHLRLVIWGTIIAHGLAPVLAVGATWIFGWEADNRVGFVMMACMAPTLVSGVVIATSAGAERAVAIILTITLNLLSILTIPWNLKWTLGATAPIDHTELLIKLIVMILIPSLVGHLVSRRWPELPQRHRGSIKYIPVVFLGIIVFVSLARQVERIKDVQLLAGISLLAGSLLVHYLLLVIGYIGARWGLGRSIPACRALAIVCSQKTIPVAVVVWQLTFAKDYPLAIIPAVIYHLSQIYADGLLANWWSKQSDKA